MNLPSDKSLKGLRDRAMLATLLYHGLRREELCHLKVKDIHSRRGSRARQSRKTGTCRSMPAPRSCSMTISMRPTTQPIRRAPYFAQSATIEPVGSTTLSHQTASTSL